VSDKKTSGADHKANMLRAGLGLRGGTNAGQAAAAVAVTTSSKRSNAPELTRSQRLTNLEAILHASAGAFRKAQKQHIRVSAEALRTIKADGLHEEAGYEDFDVYVQERVGWDLSYVYRLMDLDYVGTLLAASPIAKLTEDSLLTLNEAQARVLAKAARDHGEKAVVRAWTDAHGLGAAGTAERAALPVGENTPRSPIGEKSGEAATTLGPTPAVQRMTARLLEEAVNRLYTIPGQQHKEQTPASPLGEPGPPEGEHRDVDAEVVDAEVVSESETPPSHETPALDKLDTALVQLRTAQKSITARTINAAREESEPERFQALLAELRRIASSMDGVTERAVAKDKKLRAEEAEALPG
jgi:ribosomal protein L28